MLSHTYGRILVAAFAATLALPLGAVSSEAAGGTATMFVVQGVADSVMTISVDGRTVASNAPAKTILGPLTLTEGTHTVSAESPDRAATVVATVTLTAGSSTDTVLHRQVDPSQPPVITTFVNDLSTVAAGSGRVAVAHTAAVGPADVRVGGKVLFANIASGEALNLTVPSGSYSVDIVPNATPGPPIFGPVDLPVAPSALTRVFAIGVAATGSMDAVVQVLPLGTRGSGATRSYVNAGDGGQAASLASESFSTHERGWVGFGSLLAVAGLAISRRSPSTATCTGHSASSLAPCVRR